MLHERAAVRAQPPVVEYHSATCGTRRGRMRAILILLGKSVENHPCDRCYANAGDHRYDPLKQAQIVRTYESGLFDLSSNCHENRDGH